MKSLSQRIAEYVIKNTIPDSPSARHAVIVINQAQIREALKEGNSLLKIWETLSEEGVIKFDYQAFRRHVRKLITKPNR
ncbi:TraK family protein [Pseudomonas sp. Ps21-P2]|uniref:TraK family protein n=1 Tax=Pseudomonas sp. Ps21-P2 TaxID=3080331 RepID=UPI00320816DC